MINVSHAAQQHDELPTDPLSDDEKPCWILREPLPEFPWKLVRMVKIDPIQAALSDTAPARACISLEAFREYFSMGEQFVRVLVKSENLELVTANSQSFIPIDSVQAFFRTIVELVSALPAPAALTGPIDIPPPSDEHRHTRSHTPA